MAKDSGADITTTLRTEASYDGNIAEGGSVPMACLVFFVSRETRAFGAE